MNWLIELEVVYIGRDGKPMEPETARYGFSGYDRDESQLRAIASVTGDLITRIEDDDMCGEQRQSIQSISVTDVRDLDNEDSTPTS